MARTDAILRDIRDIGDEVWSRFNEKDPGQHLWYYGALLRVYKERECHTGMVAELEDAINALEQAIGRPVT